MTLWSVLNPKKSFQCRSGSGLGGEVLGSTEVLVILNGREILVTMRPTHQILRFRGKGPVLQMMVHLWVHVLQGGDRFGGDVPVLSLTSESVVGVGHNLGNGEAVSMFFGGNLRL